MISDDSPLVSIVILTYARPQFLKRAIESALNQTWQNVEVIVVDDNGKGTENQVLTERTVKEYSDLDNFFYVIHPFNLKGAAARNTGLKLAKGDFIGFLDDDDEFLPNKIQYQVEELLKVPSSFGAVYSGFHVFRNGKLIRSRKPKYEGNLQLSLLMLSWGFGTGSNPLFRKAVFSEIGHFDELFVRHQDWEFMVRFFQRFLIKKDTRIGVIRHIDSSINYPNPHEYTKIKDLFLFKFSQEISNYKKRDQNIIYRNQYADVALLSILQSEFKLALKYYLKACSFRVLSLRIILKAAYYIFFQRGLR